MSKSQEIEVKNKTRWRTLGIIFGVIAVLFLLTFLLLQWSPVQNWIVDQVTNRFSRNYETTINIDRVDIDFTNHVLLKGIYIENRQGDTLVSAKVLKTNLARSIFSLIFKKAFINDLTLEHGIVNITTKSGQPRSDFGEIFMQSSDVPTDTLGNSWNIKLSKAYLNDIEVNILNENIGRKDKVSISEGTLIINPNSANGIMEIKNIDLEDPSIKSEVWNVDEIFEVVDENNESENQISPQAEPVERESSLIIRRINIRNGQWSHKNMDKSSNLLARGYFDPNDIGLTEVNLEINDIEINDQQCTISSNDLKAKSKSGFDILELSTDAMSITKRKTKIDNFSLKTNESIIHNDIELSYKDWADFSQFVDKVFIKMDVNSSNISLKEIVHFIPKLKDNEFINQNYDLVASVDGEVSGRINNLRIKGLALHVGNNLKIVGNYRARDITDPEETLLNLDLTEFKSDIQTLKKIIPGFNPPTQFTRIGQFNFEGQFDGYYDDFVAFGTLRSELGTATMDMGLDLEKGRDLAEYSGSIDLQDFNLGLWTSYSDLGFVSGVAEVKNGRGLTATSASASLIAHVYSIDFKNYHYKDVGFDGTINQRLLDGALVIKDKNIDIDFNGQIVLDPAEPLYNFEAEIKKMDLFNLNLSKRHFTVTGDVSMDATNLDINNLEGDINLTDVRLQIDDSLSYVFDDLRILSEKLSDRDKKLTLQSELIDLNVQGAYQFDKIPHAFMKILASNYPSFYHKIKLPTEYLSYEGNQQYTFDIHIKNSADLLKLIKNSPVDSLVELEIKGSIDESNEIFELTALTPSIDISSNILHGLNVEIHNRGNQMNSQILLDSGYYAGQFQTQAIKVVNNLTPDTLNFELETRGVTEVVQSLVVGGQVFLEDNHYGLTLNSRDLVLMDDQWTISDNNKLLYGDNYIRVSDMHLSNGDEFIYLNSINNKGLEIGSEFFDVEFVNELWAYDKLNFRGPFDLYVRADDVFNLSNFTTNFHLDSFWINEDHYGELLLDASSSGYKQPIDVNLRIDDGVKIMTADGQITPKGFGEPTSQHTYLDLEFQLDKYPAKIIEYWIGDGVENTTGLVDVFLDMDGTTEDLRMYGVGKLRGVGTKVIYLGTTYMIEDTDIPILSDYIDLSEGALIDKYGNKGIAEGGIYHKNLRDLTLDITLSSDHFLALDTDKYHGESYYGHAIGDLNVNFTGKIDGPDIDIQGHPTTGTVLNIPLEQARALAEDDFVIFYEDSIKIDEEENRNDIFNIKELQINMDLVVDDESEVRIILDEVGENVMSGRGDGNLNVILSRAGEFNLFGNYTIDRGKYLYSYIIFQREFDVLQGGELKWTGDPFNAIIDIQAEHNLNTAVYGFISEFIPNNNDADIREAQKNQRVKVIMNMEGQLFSPDINFDLEFPDLRTGSIANFVNTKKNNLQDNPNELNRHVIGLLSSGSFISDAGDYFQNVGINAAAGYFSNRFSDALSGILRESITDVSFIDDFYISVNYNQYEDLRSGGNDNVISFSPRLELFGSKVNVDLQNYYVRTQGLNGNYYAEDLTVEWFIFNNRRLRLQAYQEYDFEFGNRKLEFGVGLNYKRDFDKIFGQKKDVKKEIQ